MSQLTEVEIDCIAERAADKAIAKVHERIGKSVATKIFWLLGVAAVGVIYTLTGFPSK